MVASGSDRGDTITPAAGGFGVRLLDPASGRTRWDRAVTPHSSAVKVVVGPTVVAVLSLPTTVDGSAFVEVLDIETGATIAQIPFEPPGVNVYDFAVTADVIAIGGFSGRGPTRTVGLDVTTGTTRWTVDGSFKFEDLAEPGVLSDQAARTSRVGARSPL